ncbi:MAG: hypothetical protein ACT4QB_10630 [Gammaproteobacteria bacterium]
MCRSRLLKVKDLTADFAVRIDDDQGNNTRWAAFALNQPGRQPLHHAKPYAFLNAAPL